jgi:pimeloyl-ACP methyl ester carboxylesterase
VRTLTTGTVERGFVAGGRRGTGAGGASENHVVIVPGLGIVGYLVPLVRELSRRGMRVTLLDLPGFGRADGVGSLPTVPAVAEAVASWCSGLPEDDRLVLLGHSTGAQAALLAAVQLQYERPPAALVLAGPTVAPNQRSLPRLLATAPMAYRRDPPVELGALGDYRLSGRDVLTLVRSAIADRPERTVRELTVPLLVTAGRCDAFAPALWLVTLTHAAASRSAQVVRLPGSHNNPFTHSSALATVMESVTTEAARLRRAGAGRTRRHVAVSRAAAP